MSKLLRVTQVRSTISRQQYQRDTLRSLGIRRLNTPVEVKDSPSTRGMIEAVRHLVRVEEIEA